MSDRPGPEGTEQLMRAAVERMQRAATRDEALAELAAGLTSALRDMAVRGISGTEAEVDVLVRSGLDRLLAEGLAEGGVSQALARAALDRLCEALRADAVSIEDAKQGLVAFDVFARRFAISDGGDHRFRYAEGRNVGRDLLISFAHSLHR